MDSKEIVSLTRDVFSVEPGKTLLNELIKELETELFDPNPNVVYYRIGKLDLVRRLSSITNNSDSILQALESDSNLTETGDI